MLSDRRVVGVRVRGVRWGVAGLVLIALVSALSACTVAVGGGVAAAVVGIGMLTSHCYDYLDVTVLDAQGRKTCAATVTASRNKSGEHFELESCYYTPLTDGEWRVRASMPGSADVESLVIVEHKDDCTRHVQSMELTLNDGRSVPHVPQPAVSAGVAAPAAPASSVFPQVTPPAATSTAPLPAPIPAGGSAGASSSSVPSSASGASSVGVFPDQGPSH